MCATPDIWKAVPNTGSFLDHDKKAASIHEPFMALLSLPNELTERIFLSTFPDANPSPSPHHGPLLLAQTCSLWRTFVLQTSSLWSSVDLKFRGTSTHNPPRDELLVLWLSRARHRSISLTIRDIGHPQLFDLLQLFPNIAHLWVHGRIRTNTQYSLPQIELAAFETLRFGHQCAEEVLSVITAPNLTYLVLRGVRRPNTLDFLLRSGSTRNITRLDLACEGATDDLRQLLRAVPRVVTLRIWDDIPKRIGHAVNVLLDAKLLPHLADLEIICWLPKTAYPIILEILQDRFEAGLTRVYIDGLCRPLTQKRTMPGWRTWRRMLALVARGLDLNIRIEPDSVIPERDEWVHTLPFIPDGPSDYDSESESD